MITNQKKERNKLSLNLKHQSESSEVKRFSRNSKTNKRSEKFLKIIHSFIFSFFRSFPFTLSLSSSTMTVENQPITQQEVPAFSSSVTALPENLQDQYVMMPVSSLTPEQHQMFFGPALEQEPVFSHVPEEFDELDFARLSMLRSMQFYHLTVFLQLVCLSFPFLSFPQPSFSDPLVFVNRSI